MYNLYEDRYVVEKCLENADEVFIIGVTRDDYQEIIAQITDHCILPVKGVSVLVEDNGMIRFTCEEDVPNEWSHFEACYADNPQFDEVQGLLNWK